MRGKGVTQKMKLIPKFISKRFSKESLVQGLMSIQAPGGEVWKDRDYENFAKEAYIKNAIAFRCIVERASAAASVPWQQFDGDEPTKEQPHWLKRANPEDSFNFLILKLMSFYHLAGNSYLEKVTPLTGNNAENIQELYVQRPDRIQTLLDTHTGAISGYKYRLSQDKTWEVDPITGQSKLLHFKTFHPTNDFYGLAPTEPAGREIDTFNEATNMNKNLLQNQGRPGLVATVMLDPKEGFTQLTDKQFDTLERQLNEKWTGRGVGKSIIVQGTRGTDIKPYGFNPQEMDFLEGGRETARRICTAYRVPPQLIGIPGESKFANYKEARASFWEDTVIGDLEYAEGELNNWIYDINSSVKLKYDLNKVPALAGKREEMWKRAQESDFLTINEKREMVGKEKTGTEGDVVYVSANLIPLGFEGESKEDQEKAMIKELTDQGFSQEEINKMIS